MQVERTGASHRYTDNTDRSACGATRMTWGWSFSIVLALSVLVNAVSLLSVFSVYRCGAAVSGERVSNAWEHTR